MRNSELFFLAIVFTFWLPAICLAQPGIAPETQNVLGIYTTPDCQAEYLDEVPQFSLVPAYVVVTNPFNTNLNLPVSLISAIEWGLVVPANGLVLGLEYPVQAINVGTSTNVIVGFGTPVPVIDGAALVGTYSLFYTSTDGSPAEFSLTPAIPASIPGHMAFLDAADDSFHPLYPSSGDYSDPVFGINTGSLWSDPIPSGDIVINPEPDSISAPWTIEGPEGFFQTGNGDQAISVLSTGEYSLTWGEVSGWGLPDENPQVLELEFQGTIEFFGEYSPGPFLTSVADIPNDQGRQVRLVWDRCAYDAPGFEYTITEYGIYRLQDDKNSNSREKLADWDFVDSVPARGDGSYQFVAPTLCDSTISGGECPSTFIVSAMTTSPFVFFDSEPMSGYSVDNLQPIQPAGFFVAFAFDGNVLTWDSPTDPDVDHYLVYRDTIPEFPGGGPLALVEGTTWTDDLDRGSAFDFYYWIVAVDHSGNHSEPTEWDTTQVSDVSDDVLPTRVNLFAAAPNPFNPMTTIKFDLPNQQQARLTIYSIDGKLVNTLMNEVKSAGSHQVIWTGQDAAGRAVSSGTYIYRLEAGDIRMQKTMTLIK